MNHQFHKPLKITGKIKPDGRSSYPHLPIEEITGKFFRDTNEIKSNQYSHDQEVQGRLWGVSVKLTIA